MRRGNECHGNASNLLRTVITISPYLLQPDYVVVVVVCCCCFVVFYLHRQGSLPHPHRCHNYNHYHHYKHHHLHNHAITNTMNTTSTMKFTKTSGVVEGRQILRRSVLPNLPIIKMVCGFFWAGFRLSDKRRCTERCGSKFASNYGGGQLQSHDNLSKPLISTKKVITSTITTAVTGTSTIKLSISTTIMITNTIITSGMTSSPPPQWSFSETDNKQRTTHISILRHSSVWAHFMSAIGLAVSLSLPREYRSHSALDKRHIPPYKIYLTYFNNKS